jgi:hypothetical protein
VPDIASISAIQVESFDALNGYVQIFQGNVFTTRRRFLYVTHLFGNILYSTFHLLDRLLYIFVLVRHILASQKKFDRANPACPFKTLGHPKSILSRSQFLERNLQVVVLQWKFNNLGTNMGTTTAEYEARFEKYAYDRTPLAVRDWVPAKDSLKVIQSALQRSLDRTTDFNLASEFRKVCPTPNTTAQDYLPKIISVLSLGSVIAGIRFREGDLRNAFVEIEWRDFDILDTEIVSSLRSVIHEEFHKFSPRSFRYLQTLTEETQPPKVESAVVDYVVFGAPVSILRRATLPANYDVVRVEKCGSIDFYKLYLDEYACFHREFPLLQSTVPPECVDSLEQSLSEGLLYKIVIYGQFAGIVSAQQDEDFCLRGFRMKEIIMFKEFRGQGYAAAALRRFIEVLQPAEWDMLYGPIDAANSRAQRNALRVGRLPLYRAMLVSLNPAGI